MQVTRFEIKMVCPEMYLPDVRSWVRLHPDGFLEAYPPRQVNNLYFDTPELDSFTDHLVGSGERDKLRFRWYGKSRTAVRGVLELKRRVSQVGWKELCPIPLTFDLTTMSWSDLMRHLRGHAEGVVAVSLTSKDRPTLLNHYWREYYESNDRQVRVTIDSDQRTYEQWTRAVPNLVFEAPTTSQVVVEVKADPELYHRVSNVLSSFPLHAERHSKYITGVMDSLYEI